MAKRRIEKALYELETDDLKRFKRTLNDVALEPGYDAIHLGMLENAKPVDIAHSIINYYREEYGLRMTASVLEAINQRPLADRLLEAVGGESHFVDWRREEIIARTSLVAPILDVLLQKKLLTPEQYDTILVKDTTQKRMRELYRFAIGWGRAGKDQLYEALKTHNGPLISDLGGL